MKTGGFWLRRDQTSDSRGYRVVSVGSVRLALVITVFKSVDIDVTIDFFIDKLALVLIFVMSISTHHFANLHRLVHH